MKSQNQEITEHRQNGNQQSQDNRNAFADDDFCFAKSIGTVRLQVFAFIKDIVKNQKALRHRKESKSGNQIGKETRITNQLVQGAHQTEKKEIDQS